jgi:hypothetical protein
LTQAPQLQFEIELWKEATMGLLDGMLGNAAKIDPAKIQQEFSQILGRGGRARLPAHL